MIDLGDSVDIQHSLFNIQYSLPKLAGILNVEWSLALLLFKIRLGGIDAGDENCNQFITFA